MRPSSPSWGRKKIIIKIGLLGGERPLERIQRQLHTAFGSGFQLGSRKGSRRETIFAQQILIAHISQDSKNGDAGKGDENVFSDVGAFLRLFHSQTFPLSFWKER